jgi:hypothetical protein
MTHPISDPVTFVVTDIETDGPSPLRNSMLSFASVAVDYEGTEYGDFEANLIPRADRTSEPHTMAWWQTEPEAWSAATSDREKPEDVMPAYVDWVSALPGFKVFVAAPIMFDGPFMDHYLDTFANARALGGLHPTTQLFRGGGVCLYTMAGTLRGQDYLNWGMQRAPKDWYGGVPHSHRAIDDARGFVNVLVKLFEMNAALPRIANETGAY